MEKLPPSWAEFESRDQRSTGRSADQNTYAELCASVFTGVSGRHLLELLHERFIDAVPKTTLTESALREWVGRRQVVRELEEQTALGLELLTKEKKA